MAATVDAPSGESFGIEKLAGYFSLERNIEGLNLLDLESTLGYPPGQLLQGARILVLLEQPSVGQFVFAGSTLTPDAGDLVPIARRQNVPIPGAWLGQRLVKVKPNLPPIKGVTWPRAKTPVEQWQLTELVKMKEVCRLGPKDVYWRRG
jgi:hypothetical protein